MAVVEVDRVCKRYGGNEVLAAVSLAIEEGRIMGLLGPNGAGKTTLIRVMLGLSAATAGSGRVFESPLPPGPKALARIGAMVEEPAFYPWMTAYRHLKVHASSAGKKWTSSEITALLERVELADAATKKVKTFSQGMRQRLGLARALVTHPQLLVLDEPANGLDPSGIIWLRRFLREMSDEGVTILVSSHQLGEIERVCDDVVILSRGRVAGAFAMDDFGDASRAVLVTVRARDREAAAKALDVCDDVEATDRTFRVRGMDSPDVARLLSEHSVFAETIQLEQPTLERVFLETIGRAQ